ncbi:MAG: glycosyltransferase, partial [candidate division WOR-3 bacterium]
ALTISRITAHPSQLIPLASEVCVLTTVHSPDDARIFHKEVKTLRSAGYTVAFIAPARRPKADLKHRLLGLCRGLIQALGTKARVFHLHDPELLPVGLVLKALGKSVVYDIHEDYPQQIKDKHYLPRWLRPIISWGLAGLEQLVVRLFDGTVAATEAIARR